MHPKYPWTASVLALAVLPVAAMAQGGPPQAIDTSAFGKPGADCAALRFTDFSAVDEAMTQITSARPVAGSDGVPAYCEVEAYIWSATRLRMRFPLQGWNGKMIVKGTGGQGGDLPPGGPGSARAAEAQLRKSFAIVHHNAGHFSTISDVKWAYFNERAMMDFGFRTPHVVGVASKAILAHFYGEKPRRSYYDGCSNGGREAMILAQRFPWDFDGIIAGAPSIEVRELTINLYKASLLLRDQSRGGFDMAAARTLHKGAIGQCDRLDGKLDGLIGDPRACKVDFKPLMCKGAASEACLTERQADIARQMYEGPRTPDGRQIVNSSAFPGSELSWVNFITPRWVIDYGNDILRYSAFYPPKGPEWTPDPSKIEDYSKQMGVGESLTSALNPDLRRFKANGGKLIAYYGWGDAFGGANAIMDYYEATERVIGGEKPTQDFFRLFMIPGMDHCGGGEGPSVFDYLGELDKWVETGAAPASLTGFHPGPDGKPAFHYSVAPYRTARPQGERR